MLLDKGAAVDDQLGSVRNASHNATENPHLDVRSKPLLIEAVKGKQLQRCVHLALGGVDINETEPVSGNTALHFAVQLGNLDLVKTLLAFRADPAMPNNSDDTPLKIAKSLKSRFSTDIVNALETMQKLQAEAKAYNEDHNEVPEKRNSHDIFLLSLDGGGIKIFNTAKTLVAIERRMKALDPNTPPLQSYFEYVAGTSAGATLAATLFYEREAVENAPLSVFKFVYEAVIHKERLRHVRQYFFDHFGEETVLSDLKQHKMMIMTVMADVIPNHLHIMSSYGEPRDNQLGPNERKLWEALHATLAAPTYLPPFERCFMDGGLIANNPTLTAMTEISEFKESGQKLACVLSIGTGSMDSVPVNVNVIAPCLSSLISSIVGLKNLLCHLTWQATRADGMIIDQAKAWCRDIDASYFRLSTNMQTKVTMGSTKITDIVALLYETEMYLLSECETVDKVAKALLAK